MREEKTKMQITKEDIALPLGNHNVASILLLFCVINVFKSFIKLYYFRFTNVFGILRQRKKIQLYKSVYMFTSLLLYTDFGPSQRFI